MKLKQVESVAGFEDVRIVYRPKLGEGVCGLTHGATGLIELSLKTNTSQEMLDSTLLHELFHMALYRSGWSEVLETANVVEEGIVIALENAFRKTITFTYKKDVEKPKV